MECFTPAFSENNAIPKTNVPVKQNVNMKKTSTRAEIVCTDTPRIPKSAISNTLFHNTRNIF